jgi:hypothetical protein
MTLESGAPSYLYLFGKRGGPYKIGFSKNPCDRATEIMRTSPGRDFAGPDGVFWSLIPFPSPEEAREAESAAHEYYEASRIYLGRSSTEWFHMMLPLDIQPIVRFEFKREPAPEERGVTVTARLTGDELRELDEFCRDIRRDTGDPVTRADIVRRAIVDLMCREKPWLRESLVQKSRTVRDLGPARAYLAADCGN